MAQRSPFLPSGDAPIRMRLVLVWGAFFAFAVGGLVLFALHVDSVPILLDLMS